MSGGDWKGMFAAACAGDLELVRFHLEAGVDVDYAHPEFQETALVAAILAGHEDVAELLLDHGADPTLMSVADQLTPVSAAQQSALPALEQRLRSLSAPLSPRES
jgi:ankyrin repeat protein